MRMCKCDGDEDSGRRAVIVYDVATPTKKPALEGTPVLATGACSAHTGSNPDVHTDAHRADSKSEVLAIGVASDKKM